MFERQLVDLQTRSNQHRQEIDGINAQLTEMKILIKECCRKCELVSYHEEFKDNQAKLNQEVSSRISSGAFTTQCLDKQFSEFALDFQRLCRHVDGLVGQIHSLTESLIDCHHKLDSLDLPLEISRTQADVLNLRTNINFRLEEILERLVMPFEDIISTQDGISMQSEKALDNAEKAKIISERIGVEIRVLNRKMNEILGKIGL